MKARDLLRSEVTDAARLENAVMEGLCAPVLPHPPSPLVLSALREVLAPVGAVVAAWSGLTPGECEDVRSRHRELARALDVLSGGWDAARDLVQRGEAQRAHRQ